MEQHEIISIMEHNKKVFTSDIIRSNNTFNNNLYDLLEVVPAKSLSVNIEHTSTCDFTPNTDKYYVPKKKSKLKVKTVRSIRELFEKEVYSDLHIELEKHRHALLRKIRIGSSREEATKKMAKIIFRSDSPISRDIWQMLTHLNPVGHPHSSQFVLWNRRFIQINGSKGGKNKFICNFDIGKDNIRNLSKPVVKPNKVSHRKTMLQKSIYVKFKPGPLSKKKYLDTSYQKFNYGNSTIVSLPKPGLDIQPSYGIPLGPTMANFLNENYMRNSKGEITDKWVDFSLSVLGVNKNGCPVQINKDACISFDIQYKCNQHRILMRNAIDNNDNIFDGNCIDPFQNNQTNINTEVNIVMSKILNYVEIKLELENHNSSDDLPHAYSESNENNNGILKEKGKRKFGELDRLDVTVIKLSSAQSENAKCEKAHCSFGCICSSLECSYNLKCHCGHIECMFECKCMQWFSKSSDSSLSLSGLDDLNKTLNSGLAKEEQKFRQTVVFSGEKSILLKPQRRDWKSSKKYAEFYSNMCLKTETKSKKELIVVTPKLNCDNIEPWCMVHNLYKCFCKGKFTERASPLIEKNDVVVNTKDINESAEVVPDKIDPEPLKNRLRRHSHKQNTDTINIEQDNVIKEVFKVYETNNDEIMRCARLNPYKGKKYTDDYYSETNRKIIEMEKNDRSLQKKLLNLINVGDGKESDRQSNAICPKEVPKRLPNKRKLVAWLEASFKHYKECKAKGLLMTSLEPPNETKLAFHSWEFILGRYRERKNLFLVTPQKPYRIFLAVKKDHPKLETCINVNDLDLTDVQEYPNTVKNLISNAVSLKDNFCILRGLSYCWELVGTVTKVSEIRDASLNSKGEGILNFGKASINNCNQLFDEESQNECRIENMQIDIESLPAAMEQLKSDNKVNEISKWFVMTVENDFNEIHFYKKGFFVKYDSVLKAINVSRVSNKTVRLSSQKCSNGQNGPQFGIYAIPNEKDLNVFIGPYENDESLGIETVKTILPRDNTRQTRGTWIKVNKIDNVKIIDQPLAFLPSKILSQEMLPLEREFSCVKETKTDNESIQTDIKNDGPRVTKTVKPIKILKSNGFYQLWPKIASTKSLATLEQNTTYPIPQSCVMPTINSNSILTIRSSESDRKTCKPVAEIAPQIKVTEQTENKIPNTNARIERGMCILKPEEINKRSLLMDNSAGSSIIETIHDDIDRDIENFLATSTACKLPNEDIYIISDDENEERDTISDVWIQSSNIPNLGWIPAKRNSSKHISFEFPGFKYTDFYTEEEAFRKINLVFSRKVYVPKAFDFNWEIVENKKDLRTKNKLVANELGPEFVLTSKGLIPRFKVIPKRKETLDTENRNIDAQKRKLIMEDCISSTLEDENKKLCIEAVSKKCEIMQSISQANNTLRKEMAERLGVLLAESKSQTDKMCNPSRNVQLE